MSKENKLLKEVFTFGHTLTGLVKDPPDNRDYKFSTIMKKKGLLKAVKKKVKKYVKPERGKYRKPHLKKSLETVDVVEYVPTESFILNSPSFVDHSANMSSVKNQGDRGTCVGFAACALKECQEKVEHDREVSQGKVYGAGGKTYDYSEQWLYWYCKQIDEYEGEGTYIRAAMKVLNKRGVPLEDAWPYTDDPINIGEPKNWAGLIARWAMIGSYWSIDNLTELKTALIDSPCLIGIPIFREWANPPHGKIDYPANPNESYGGHAVCVVGYDDNKQLIKFKNSWTKYWGDLGYGYLPYRYIRDFLWSGWAARDIVVTKDMLDGPDHILTPLEW